PAGLTPPPQAPPGYGPPPAPPPYFEYDEPRRRAIWPWLLGVLLLAAAVVGGWYVYTKIQDQLAANKPVPVPFVEGIRESNAVKKVRDAGLSAVVHRVPSDKVQATYVFDQRPSAGD